MSVLKGLFRSTSRDTSPSGSPQKKKEDELPKVEIENVMNDQPHNPYTEIQLLSHHTGTVHHLVVVDQYSVASAGSDGLVVLWGLEGGEVQQVLDGHGGRPITCLEVMQHTAPADSTEYTALVTAASDRHVIMWDVGSGTQLHKLTTPCSTPRCILPIEFEGERSMFCSGGESLYLWSEQCELLDTIVGDNENGEDIERLLQIKKTKMIGVIDKALYLYRIKGLNESSKETNPEIKLEFVQKLPPHREAITSVAKINDTSFASGSLDGSIRVWSCNTPNAPIRELNLQHDYHGDMRHFPFSVQDMLLIQQRYLVAGIGNGLAMYDAITGALVARVPKMAHANKIRRVLLAHHGKFLMTTASDGHIRLWGRAKCFQNPPPHHASSSSPIETLLAVPPEELRQQDHALDLELLGGCIGTSGSVDAVLVCPGGELVATGGPQGELVLWKDGLQEKLKRWQKLRAYLHGTSPPDDNV